MFPGCYRYAVTPYLAVIYTAVYAMLRRRFVTTATTDLRKTPIYSNITIQNGGQADPRYTTLEVDVMASPKPLKIPKLCLHKASGRAYAKKNGRRTYFGRYGTDEAIEAYNRWVARLLAGEPPLEDVVDQSAVSIIELCAAYRQWAEGYYRKDGKLTSEINHVAMFIRSLLKCHGTLEVSEFTPNALRSIQSTLVREGRPRVTVNLIVSGIVRIFRWGVSRGMVAAEVHQALTTVDSLRKGRTKAREMPPVLPVPDSVIDATLPYMGGVVADMVRLQRLSGARPGEICCLRPCDVDRSGEIWEYVPETHKTEHHDRQRVVYFGPKAQAILARYLLRDAETPCFPSQRSPEYSAHSYGQAVKRAAEAAGVESWTPNRLRHTAATKIRKKFGLESAQVTLGHSRADTTEIYAEKDAELAREVARRIG